MNCYYCDLIAAANACYRPRPADYDLGSEAPRCAWHWRFVCDHCRQAGHFMSRFHCPDSDRLLCREAGQIEIVYGDFEPWGYWWTLACPACDGRHPSLDYAAFAGVHPWQIDPAAEASRRWLAPETYLVRYPPACWPRLDMDRLTDADSDANWSANADLWEAGYDEHGDTNRKYFSDPALLAFLGDVRGRRVLDAGSGAGYLSRLLAKRNAHVVAVENARRFHEIALAHQAREPLDIAFHHASLSAMPFLESGSFDAVVANYVLIDVRDYETAIAEIARLLKQGGHFVFSVTHTTIDFAWHIPACDSPRREDRTAWRDDEYFIRRAGYMQWGDLKPILGFHRPLRDYVAACKRAGLELRDLDEPEISDEGRRELPPPLVHEAQRLPVSYVLKCVNSA